jgi:hypothetical protein
MPQCKAGFSGIPIDMNEDETGIQYIGCAVASIMTDSAPWNLTGYQREPEFTKRSDNIAKLVKKFATVIIQDSSVQQQLIMKRAYLMSVYGKETLDTKLHERLPYRFLPAMLEKEETVVTSAATPMNVIRGWMAIADKHAVENSDIVKGSPNMESSCCFIPINQPGSFWLDKGLPDIGRKLQLDGPVGSHIAVHISPRRPPRIKVSIPDAIYYKVFLKLCFTGIRKGLPHEPGYDRVCPHCNFVFPMDPFEALESIPSSSDKRTQKELLKEYDAKSAELVQLGKVALTEQGIDINKDTFDVLLDDAHLQNRVAKVSKIRPKAGLELMQELANIQPEPYTGWRALMAQTITNVESLAEDASETEVAEVYGPLSMKTDEFMRDLQERLSEKQVTTLRMMLQQPVTHMVESVQTYFLVTFQRILCGFKPESLDIPKRGLGTDTIDHLKEMLKFHMNILGKLQNTHIFVKSKLTHARDCLVAVLKIIQKNIRTPYIPGGENGVPYIINSLILGILDEFGNPNITPISVSERASAVSVEARTPLIIIDACLTQFRAEALNFTDTQIQEEIERRGQLEREYFTKNKEKLSPDEARIYMIQQRLGLGKFAVGKGIQKYDVEQAQLDAEQRTAMGINDTEFFEQQEEADGGYDDGAQDFEDNF